MAGQLGTLGAYTSGTMLTLTSTTFAERKAERTAYYFKYVHGWALAPCDACAGSGYYDDDGSPPCGSCDGSGQMRVPPSPTPPG